MPQIQYAISNPITMNSVVIPAGTIVATITTPDNVPVERALSAISRGLTVPPDPKPETPVTAAK